MALFICCSEGAAGLIDLIDDECGLVAGGEVRATSSEVERSDGEAVEQVLGQILHLVAQQERVHHEVGQHAKGFKDLQKKEIGN